MNTKEIEESILKETIKPLFKQHEFRISGKTFLKQHEDFIKVFNIQSSQWNERDRLKFTFNIGFFLPETYEFWTQKPVPRNIKSYDCVFQLRPGPIIKSGTTDYWYEIDLTTDVIQQKKLIYEHLTIYILPFYNKHQTLEDLLTLQDSGITFGGLTKLQIALIFAKKGYPHMAEKEINSFLQSKTLPDDWIFRIKSEAMKRGVFFEG